MPARVTLGGGPQLTLIRALTDSGLSCWCDGMLTGREQPINVKPTEYDNKLEKAASFLAHPSKMRRDGQGYSTHWADKE